MLVQHGRGPLPLLQAHGLAAARTGLPERRLHLGTALRGVASMSRSLLQDGDGMLDCRRDAG